MRHPVIATVLISFIAASAIAQGTSNGSAQPRQPLPTLKSGEMPLYPPLARLAHIEGNVKLRVSTDGERVTGVSVEEGQPMLAKAAEANVKTWQFVNHNPTVFETTFAFHLVEQTGCKPLSNNGKIMLNLPDHIDVTAPGASLGGCDPDAGLDLSEPLRVFLTRCEADGVSMPCSKLTITLTSGRLEVRPKTFSEQDGRTGFVVPTDFRGLNNFGVVIDTPKGAFTLQDVDASFLKGKWHVIIDHSPFQEEWRYLAHGQQCMGIIHFEWSEPETLAVTTCH